MRIEVDRLTWLPCQDINVDGVKRELTQKITPYRGDPEDVFLYDDTSRPGFLGVPRRWGILKFGPHVSNVTDLTTLPAIAWPDTSSIAYWPGQADSVEALLRALNRPLMRKGTGALLEAGCGAGKTLMGLSVASRLCTPTLIVVPKTDLAEQWHNTANAFFPGVRVGHVQGAKRVYEDCHLTTARVQTLHLQRDKLVDFWKAFGLIIYDEGHRFPARTFMTSLDHPHARYRLGVSATWRRADGMECAWQFHVGVVEHISQVPKLTGKYVQVKYEPQAWLNDHKFCYSGWPPNNSKYITAISEDVGYNNWLLGIIKDGAAKGRQLLVASDRVAQLTWLRRQLELSPYTSALYIGQVPTDGKTKSGKPKTRKMTKQEVEDAKKANVVLATYHMMSEGTDIPSLDTLILATPRVDVEQIVGRIRRPADKKDLLVVDCHLDTVWYNSLAAARRKVYDRIGFKQH